MTRPSYRNQRSQLERHKKETAASINPTHVDSVNSLSDMAQI
ncbi:MAG: hypothetical protein AAFQ41_06870 [Cyanobacteria bacterium J06623_7]